MERIIVVCAGGHGAVVADILRCAQRAGAAVVPIGFVDDTPDLQGGNVEGLPVLGRLSDLQAIAHDAVVVALGDNAIRRRMIEQLAARGERFASAVHPAATIAATVQVGPAVVISAGAVVQPRVVLGSGVILNTRCSVDHDTVVGDCAHVSPGVTVGAHVQIGEETLIAVGASVVARRTIGSRAVIGAGAVVVRDLPDDVVAFGIPARIRSLRQPSMAPEIASGQ